VVVDLNKSFQGTKVSEATTFSTDFFKEVTSPTAASFVSEILSYRGELPVPLWMDVNPDDFKTLCIIDADLSRLCRPSDLRTSGPKPYWRLEFDIEVKFGLTEYEARIRWIEDGVIKYGPASIIYEDESTHGHDK